MNRKVALIGDIACLSGSSIMSQIPIISAFGDRACINFNSYLSTNSSYTEKSKYEVSKNFNDTFESWEKNNVRFDAIITGYIDNPSDILRVREYVSDAKLDNPKTFLLVDPAFADDGKTYCSINENHIINYRKLIEIADLITPNLSEACFLTESSYTDYKDKYITIQYEGDNKEKVDGLSKKIIESIFPLVDKLRIKKNQATIITGIELYNSILTILDVFDGDHGKRQTTCNYSSKVEARHGAGDIFDAMYLETCLSGFNLVDALSVTTSFINNSLRYTRDQKIDSKNGILYEPILHDNITVIKNKLKDLHSKSKEEKKC